MSIHPIRFGLLALGFSELTRPKGIELHHGVAILYKKVPNGEGIWSASLYSDENFVCLPQAL